MPRLRTVFLGWGAINTRVGELLRQRSAVADIVGIATRDAGSVQSQIPAGARHIDNPDQLAKLKPDLVVEAAGSTAVAIWAPAALRHAKALIVASTSAFCDDELLPRLQAIATKYGSHIIVPSGAIGAVDALASAAVLGLDDVVHQVIKPPLAWRGTPAEKSLDLASLAERRVFFSGPAREAAAQYPQNANATVVTSLAGVGLDRTRVELIADPEATTNGHRIVARGIFGTLDVTLRNSPLSTNPKSSELTALSLVRLIEQQVAVLRI